MKLEKMMPEGLCHQMLTTEDAREIHLVITDIIMPEMNWPGPGGYGAGGAGLWEE